MYDYESQILSNDEDISIKRINVSLLSGQTLKLRMHEKDSEILNYVPLYLIAFNE